MGVPWPVSLQGVMNEEGFSFKIGDTTIRSETEFGIPKVRRRFTRGIDVFTFSINLSSSQYSTFKTFYESSLNGGVLPFDFLNPLTNTTDEFRFLTSPSIRSIGGGNFILQMEVERMP